MNIKRILLALLQIAFIQIYAQQVSPTAVIKLWPEGAPTSNGLVGDEIDYGTHVTNVTEPEITIYVPEHPCGLAVLACPGGGYVDVWYSHEGQQMADWYNSQGVVYAVLKYRLPNGHKEVPLDDVQRAMQIIRSYNKEWNIQQLGIQGCSAGGHLAAMASTHYTNDENRPDFQILFYPVITLDPTFTHDGTLRYLLGEKPSKKLIEQYSNERQVTIDTPPAFIVASTDDDLVPVRNSIEYYNALLAHGVSVTMQLFPEGGHGWCWKDSFRWKPQYLSSLSQWLHTLKPKKRVLFIGDSITDGGWGKSGGDMRPSSERTEWDKNHVYGHGFVEQTASYLESKYPEDEITFWNRGISGNSLAQMCERWQEDAIRLQPNVISILIGTNDVHYYLEQKEKGQIQHFDFEAWEARYRHLLDQTIDSLPGVQFVLCTPFTARVGRAGDAANYEERASLISELAAIVRRIAADYHATLIPYDTMFGTLRKEHATTNNAYWIWDGIHPTPAGHQRMSQLWIENVEPWLCR